MKVSELQGVLLDYWVARAVGLEYAKLNKPVSSDPVWCSCARPDWVPEHRFYGGFRPSTDWEHGGPLIEMFEMDIAFRSSNKRLGGPALSGLYGAYLLSEGGQIQAEGPTLLTAAMRAIVASKFGEEVEEVVV